MDKVVLQFNSCFWGEKLSSFNYASSTPGEFRWWFSLYPSTKEPILVAFNNAKAGRQLEELSDEEILAKAMGIIRKCYGNYY